MKKMWILCWGALLLLLLPSCFSVGGGTPREQTIKLREFKNEDNIPASARASAFAEGFFQAVKSGDFAQWRPFFPPDDASRIDQKKFDKMRAELQTAFGDFESGSYLGELTVGELRNYLWKMRFSRQEKDHLIIREVTFFVRIYCEDGKKPEVSGFGVKVF